MVASPWAFGGVDPEWQYPIAITIGLLIACWLVRGILYRRISFRSDWVSFGLAGLLLISAFQLIPLPMMLVSVLSPFRAADHRSLNPESLERIGPDDPVAAPSSFVTLSVDPSLTRHFVAEVALLLGVYVVARNWLATRNSLRRFAWVMGVNGFLVAALGFAQAFLANGKMYWSFPTGSMFGPFVCRNHYPFFAELILGLLIGLALNYSKSEYSGSGGEKGFKGLMRSSMTWFSHATQSPFNVVLLSMAMVVAISIPFSLSRGGMVTLIVTSLFLVWLLNTGGSRQGLAVPLVIAAFAIALGAWLGWGPIERRLGGLSEGIATQDNRSELWKSALSVFFRFPVFGCGANGFQRVEPAYRNANDDNGDTLVNDSVHNEYLEALAEGGLLRLAFTVAIAIGGVHAAVRAYRRLGNRSNGSIAVGMAFGLLGVAVHSAFDFGVHIPAIGLLAVVAAAYAEAAASDSEFVPTRKTKSTSSEIVSDTELGEANTLHRAQAVTLTGPPSWAMIAVIAMAVLVIVRQFRNWDNAERYRSAAIATGRAEGPASDLRIRQAEAAALATPDNPELHLAHAKAHFDAALTQGKPGGNLWKISLPEETIAKHIRPALQAVQQARALCPYLAPAHMRLAVYRDFCVSADPAATYLARAIRLNPSNPEGHYAAGLEAISRRDLNAASEHWKHSLSLNDRKLNSILEAAKTAMTPVEIRDSLLPDDPAVLLAAADKLYPDRKGMAASRAPLLERAKKIAETRSTNSAGLEALARIEYEQGNTTTAQLAYRRAIDLTPNDVNLRIRYAAWLESEELVEPLISELEWLKAKGAGTDISNRIEVARRALELKTIILK